MSPAYRDASFAVEETTPASRRDLAELLGNTVRTLSAARGAVESWKLIAVTAIQYAHEQWIEIGRLKRQLTALREELRRYTAGHVRRDAA